MTDEEREQKLERQEQIREGLKARKAEAVAVLMDNLKSDVPIAQVLAARAILELENEIFEAEVDAEDLHVPPIIY